MMKSKETKMAENTDQTNIQQTQPRPNETGGIHYEDHIKIFDPETQEIYVEGRA